MNIKTDQGLFGGLFIILLIITAAAGSAFAVGNGRFGELDPGFNPVALNSTVNNNLASANAVLVQPDGKVLYAGNFLSVDRLSRNYIVRFAVDGTVDTSFDSGGTVDGYINSMALQPDGKIVVVGKFSNVAGEAQQGIARLNADGTYDPTFRVAFTPNMLIENNGLALQSDGKIVFTGNFSQVAGQTRNNFARVLADGSLDTSFTAPANCFGRRVAFQPDGKIIVNSSCGGNTGISRLNENGAVDPSFNAGSGANGTIDTVVLQSDGKILLGGQFTSFGGQTRNGLARLGGSGSLDTAFDPAVPQFFESQAIAIQPDGKILAARSLSGIGGSDNSVLRINTDGTLDTTFIDPPSAYIYAIAAAPDGKIYEGGKMATFRNSVFAQKPFLRTGSDGSIDFSFDPFVAAADDAPLMANAVAQPDGKVLVRGAFLSINRQSRSGLARVNTDGTTDTTFTLAANVSIKDGTHSDNALVLQPDGKILVNGKISGGANNNVVRLNANGSLDTSFNVAGGADLNINKIALLPDGKILVGGVFTAIGGQTRNSVARLNSDGSVDSFQPNFASPNMTVTSLTVQPDGKFLVTGAFGSVNGTARSSNVRFNADGTIDSSFVNTNLGIASPYLAIQPDGKLIVDEGGFIARVNADNTPDNTFTPVTFYVSVNNQGSIRSAAIQPDGKILIGGNFFYAGNYSLPPHPNVARLNADGKIDQTFINNGGTSGNFNASSGGGAVQQISLEPDGKILLAGFFRTYNNFGRFGVARLKRSVMQANRIADFDGDGRSDLAVFRPSDNIWYMQRSTSGPWAVNWGLATDKMTAADFDGDGKTDVAVWRESAANPDLSYYYILRSGDNTVGISQFGRIGDSTIVTGDWDGDGVADPAVYRNAADGTQSYFYYRGSLGNEAGTVTYVPWGVDGDKPVRGDFDGDGRLDAAIYRPSDGTYYIRQSSDGESVYRQFGSAGDKLVDGDFDGDGKDDIAVFRPSTGIWYIWQSASNHIRYEHFGLGTDTLVPADYDGDGKTDIAVYRSGTWYIRQSSDGQIIARNFGTATDIPVESAFE